MISFQELMQKYYSDPKSGIRNEEAPTNSTGPAIANPDRPLIDKKKKKDMTYDGRTKIVKELVKRIMLAREKRASKKE
jgi:hypothetical protein